MNAFNTNSFSIYIGIDWADTKHDICLQVANESQRSFDVIDHQV